MIREGKCSCGKIKFTVKDIPINTLFCYCKECQISCGSDKFFGIWYYPEQFKLKKGKPKEYIRKSDNSGEIYFKFCGFCGTRIFGKTADGIIIVSGATLNNFEGLEPKMAIYTKSAPKWAILPTNIPCFETFPDNY